MPRTKGIPAYKRHKASEQARVIIDGHHVYLGPHGSPESHEEYARVIATSELNKAVHALMDRVRPPATKSGRHLKFYYAAQTGTKPPTFALYVNNPRYRYENYVSYLERGLRDRFGLEGTPIILDWKRSH